MTCRTKYNLAFFGAMLPAIFLIPALLMGGIWIVLQLTGQWPELYRVGLYLAGFIWGLRLLWKHRDALAARLARPLPAWWLQEARRPISKFEQRLLDGLLHVGAPAAIFAVFFLDDGFRGRDGVARWNDGSFGYMQSRHYRDMVPGGDGWNDLWWLGEPQQWPISSYNCLVWALNHPDVLIGTLLLALIAWRLASYLQGRKSQ